jgi:hypothetical protein
MIGKQMGNAMERLRRPGFGQGRQGLAQAQVTDRHPDQACCGGATEKIPSQGEQLRRVAGVTDGAGGRSGKKRGHERCFARIREISIHKNGEPSVGERFGQFREQLVNREGDHTGEVPTGDRVGNARTDAVVTAEDVPEADDEHRPIMGRAGGEKSHQDRRTSSSSEPSGAINWTSSGM